MLLIWKIEDQDLFQHGVNGGKGELSKTLFLKVLLRTVFIWLFTSHKACRNILFMYIMEKNSFPGEFLASFLMNIIIIIGFCFKLFSKWMHYLRRPQTDSIFKKSTHYAWPGATVILWSHIPIMMILVRPWYWWSHNAGDINSRNRNHFDHWQYYY